MSPLHAAYSGALYAAGVAALPVAAVGYAARPRWRFAVSERFGRYGEAVRALADRRPFWIHAASIGEVNAAFPLLAAVRYGFEGVPLIVSTTTPEGHAVAEDLAVADAVVLAPLDFPHTVARAMKAIRPRALILLETELWPNLLRQARHSGAPVLLVNGRISDRSFPRYRRARNLVRRVLADLRLAGMQSQKDLERILALGADPERACVLGNLKYDTLALKPPDPPDALREMNGPILVAGSTHPGEETILAGVFRALKDNGHPDLRMIVAPRHIARADEAERDLRAAGLNVVRRAPGEVVLLDTAGELAGTYSLATAAFVGGSLVPRGGHNPLEVLWHGVPVAFGPHTENFAEVTARVLEAGGARQVADAEELRQTLDEFLRDPAGAGAAQAKQALVAGHGAVARVLELLEPLA